MGDPLRLLQRALNEVALQGRRGASAKQLWTLLGLEDDDEDVKKWLWRQLLSRQGLNVSLATIQLARVSVATKSRLEGYALADGKCPRWEEVESMTNAPVEFRSFSCQLARTMTEEAAAVIANSALADVDIRHVGLVAAGAAVARALDVADLPFPLQPSPLEFAALEVVAHARTSGATVLQVWKDLLGCSIDARAAEEAEARELPSEGPPLWLQRLLDGLVAQALLVWVVPQQQPEAQEQLRPRRRKRRRSSAFEPQEESAMRWSVLSVPKDPWTWSDASSELRLLLPRFAPPQLEKALPVAAVQGVLPDGEGASDSGAVPGGMGFRQLFWGVGAVRQARAAILRAGPAGMPFAAVANIFGLDPRAWGELRLHLTQNRRLYGIATSTSRSCRSGTVELTTEYAECRPREGDAWLGGRPSPAPWARRRRSAQNGTAAPDAATTASASAAADEENYASGERTWKEAARTWKEAAIAIARPVGNGALASSRDPYPAAAAAEGGDHFMHWRAALVRWITKDGVLLRSDLTARFAASASRGKWPCPSKFMLRSVLLSLAASGEAVLLDVAAADHGNRTVAVVAAPGADVSAALPELLMRSQGRRRARRAKTALSRALQRPFSDFSAAAMLRTSALHAFLWRAAYRALQRDARTSSAAVVPIGVEAAASAAAAPAVVSLDAVLQALPLTTFFQLFGCPGDAGGVAGWLEAARAEAAAGATLKLASPVVKDVLHRQTAWYLGLLTRSLAILEHLDLVAASDETAGAAGVAADAAAASGDRALAISHLQDPAGQAAHHPQLPSHVKVNRFVCLPLQRAMDHRRAAAGVAGAAAAEGGSLQGAIGVILAGRQDVVALWAELRRLSQAAQREPLVGAASGQGASRGSSDGGGDGAGAGRGTLLETRLSDEALRAVPELLSSSHWGSAEAVPPKAVEENQGSEPAAALAQPTRTIRPPQRRVRLYERTYLPDGAAAFRDLSSQAVPSRTKPRPAHRRPWAVAEDHALRSAATRQLQAQRNANTDGALLPLRTKGGREREPAVPKGWRITDPPEGEGLEERRLREAREVEYARLDFAELCADEALKGRAGVACRQRLRVLDRMPVLKRIARVSVSKRSHAEANLGSTSAAAADAAREPAVQLARCSCDDAVEAAPLGIGGRWAVRDGNTHVPQLQRDAWQLTTEETAAFVGVRQALLRLDGGPESALAADPALASVTAEAVFKAFCLLWCDGVICLPFYRTSRGAHLALAAAALAFLQRTRSSFPAGANGAPRCDGVELRPCYAALLLREDDVGSAAWEESLFLSSQAPQEALALRDVTENVTSSGDAALGLALPATEGGAAEALAMAAAGSISLKLWAAPSRARALQQSNQLDFEELLSRCLPARLVPCAPHADDGATAHSQQTAPDSADATKSAAAVVPCANENRRPAATSSHAAVPERLVGGPNSATAAAARVERYLLSNAVFVRNSVRRLLLCCALDQPGMTVLEARRELGVLTPAETSLLLQWMVQRGMLRPCHISSGKSGGSDASEDPWDTDFAAQDGKVQSLCCWGGDGDQESFVAAPDCLSRLACVERASDDSIVQEVAAQGAAMGFQCR